MASVSRLNRIRDIVTFGVLGLLGVVVALMYYQFHNLKDDLRSEVALAKEHAQNTNERLLSLERDVSEVQRDQSSARSVVANIKEQISGLAQNLPPMQNLPPNPKPPPEQPNAWQITSAENKKVRAFLEKVNGLDPIVEAGYRVGDKIPSDKLRDFSVILTDNVPTLKNTRYTIDQKSSIIIVSGEDRVVAILATKD